MSQWVLHNRSFAWNKRFLPDKKITLAFVQYVQMQGRKSYTWNFEGTLLDRENGFYRKKSTVGFGSQKTIVLLDNALDDL